MKFIFSLAILAIATTCSAQKNFIDQPYITVTGSADTFITPNEIFIKITLSEKDSRNKISVEEQEEKLVKGLEGLGINTQTNLSVFDFGSNYRFYLFKKKDVIKTKQYTLKVSDAVMVGKVFMMLEEQDFSNAAIDRVNHTEIEKIRLLVKRKAIDNAKEKATVMVEALKQTVGPAILINDTEYDASENLAERRLQRGRLKKDSYKSETGTLEFEKIEVNASVAVNFILK